MLSWREYFLVGLVVVAVVVWRRVNERVARNPLRRPLPPGPPGLPIIKNVLDFPQGNSWLKFSEWRRTYGDIVHVELLGEHIVVVNSFARAKEMLDQSKYADRPRFVMAGEMMGFEATTMLSPYNDHWKFLRKMSHQGLCKPAAATFWPYHEADAREFVKQLLKDSSDHQQTLRFILGKNILKSTYGLNITTPAHELITMSEGMHHDLALALVPGSFLVDVLPWLKNVPSWFPGAGFQKHAAQTRVKGVTMVESPYNHVKTSFESGTAPPSFVATILSQKESDPTNRSSNFDHAVKWAAASLYGAATEAGFGALSTFFLAMAMYPDIQYKAQQELDAVVGDRLPTLADRDKLPYIDAIMKETLRWHPPLPVGVAHRAVQDDYVDGYYIPKGSIVIPNEWEMSQDPAFYRKPSEFYPERFLGDSPELSPYDFVFGFGRRLCPGMHYATAITFSIITSFLATLEIRAQDKDGRPVSLGANFADAFVSFAEDFPCRIVPRRNGIAEALAKED